MAKVVANTRCTVDVPVEAAPWSPWLRRAHVTRYQPDSAVGELRRIRDWELVLQLQGESWVWWERLGASEPVPPGSLFLVAPGEVHAQGPVGEHLAVHFDLIANPSLVMPFMVETLPAFRRRVDSPARLRWRLRTPSGILHEIPAVTHPAAPQAWRERLMPLVRQCLMRHDHEPAFRLQATGIIASALHDLAGESGRIIEEHTSADSDLALQLSFLDLGSRRWTVPALARRLGMSESSFRTAFRRLTPQPPRAWLEERRFEHARHLLLTTTRPIGRIAAACGYDDPFHFSRVCRRLTGQSPSDLREQGGSSSGAHSPV